MTKYAMSTLLEWASKKDKEYQMRFTEYYESHKAAALNDEMLGGRIGNSSVTSQMMKWLIVKFEEGNKLIPSFTEKEIYN